MRIIYNEGRVVGLSAYEMYVRQALEDDPSAEVLSEAEWLKISSTIGTQSMILRLPNGTAAGVHNILLPEGSQLCACTPLRAHMFEGRVTVDASGYWATNVTDYGRLIQNDDSLSPATPGDPNRVPVKVNATVIPEEYQLACANYMKLNSAIFLQPGTWSGNPPKTLQPDLTKVGYVRISVAEELTSDVLIMITGFTNKSMIKDPIPGGTGSEQSIASGGFLGPAEYPWACKIFLEVTTDVVQAYEENYTMTLSEYQALPTKENHFYYCKEDPE